MKTRPSHTARVGVQIGTTPLEAIRQDLGNSQICVLLTTQFPVEVSGAQRQLDAESPGYGGPTPREADASDPRRGLGVGIFNGPPPS